MTQNLSETTHNSKKCCIFAVCKLNLTKSVHTQGIMDKDARGGTREALGWQDLLQ